MNSFKLGKELSEMIIKKRGTFRSEKEEIIYLRLIEQGIERTINKIADAIERNEVEKQTIIKRDGSFKKIFFNILNLDQEFTNKIITGLSKEIKDYVISNGYIELDTGILTYQDHKVIIRIKNEIY